MHVVTALTAVRRSAISDTSDTRLVSRSSVIERASASRSAHRMRPEAFRL
jgi:hypothetical protein